jgi:hypothetical protein
MLKLCLRPIAVAGSNVLPHYRGKLEIHRRSGRRRQPLQYLRLAGVVKLPERGEEAMLAFALAPRVWVRSLFVGQKPIG